LTPLVSVIIPNWNGQHHLPVCLNSLRQQQFGAFEVILVDNASTDGSQQLVRERYPEVRLLELAKNYGFASACNAGIRVAHPAAQFVALLNNDTESDPGWLKAIVEAFDTQPAVGIVASKMMLFDQRDHFHSAGDFVRIDGTPGNRGVWQLDQGQYDVEEEVFSACAGAAAYRRRMLDEIGLLDEVFFFSCEDVDLSWRAQLAGWRVLYVPQAVVYHKLKATGGSITGSYFDGRNFLYLIAKNYPTGLLRRQWRHVCRRQWRIAMLAARHWRGAAARARLRGLVVGMLTLPRMWAKRRQIQAARRISDESLLALMRAVDDTQGGG